MLLNQILTTPQSNPYSVIKQCCSQYLRETEGLPLYKNLSRVYENLHKVKARRRNLQGTFPQIFNEAFDDRLDDICQKAIFSYSQPTYQTDANSEPFYIFPIDGYKFMYSPEVCNSNTNYKQVFETIFDQFGSDTGKGLLTDLLKFAYKHDNLTEGILKKAEIVFYNIPFYYAVRVKNEPDYDELLNSL